MDFKEILLSGKNSDFTIRVKHTKFQVHKIILGARSPVFAAMMEHEMKEKLSGEVSIQDADPAIFQEFLFYIYSGREENISWNKNVTDLFKLADKYCVDDLRWLCVERMKDYISVENFFDILHISQQLKPTWELWKVIIRFFIEESKEIVKNEMFIENYLEIFHISQKFSSVDCTCTVAEEMIQFFLKDSKAIIENKNKKWIQFLKEYPEESAVLTKALGR